METVKSLVSKEGFTSYKVYDDEFGSALWRDCDIVKYDDCYVRNIYSLNGVPVIQVRSMNDNGHPGMFKPTWVGYNGCLVAEALNVFYSEDTCKLFEHFKDMIKDFPIGQKSLICRMVAKDECTLTDRNGEDYGGGQLAPPYDMKEDEVYSKLIQCILRDAKNIKASPEVIVLPHPKDKIGFKYYIGCYLRYSRFNDLLKDDSLICE